MCGLVGVAGGLLSLDLEKMFKTMWLMDTVRGVDSAGLVKVNPQNVVQMDRAVGCPPDLYDPIEGKTSSILTRKGIPIGMSKVLMGHNRAATVGKITEETAHPFNYGKIWGMHNGTMPSWRKAFALEGEADEDTDTKQMLRYLSKHGIRETWKRMTSTDAAAIVWWDGADNTLNMIRNDHRPLYVATTDCEQLMWASEPWMITVAAWRHNVKLKKDKEKPLSIATNRWLQFSFGKKNAISLASNIPLGKCDAVYTPVYTIPRVTANASHFKGANKYSESKHSSDIKEFYNKHKEVLKRFREYSVKDWRKIDETSTKADKSFRLQMVEVVDISLMSNRILGSIAPKIKARFEGGEELWIHANAAPDVRKMAGVKLHDKFQVLARPRRHERSIAGAWYSGQLQKGKPVVEYHIMYGSLGKMESKSDIPTTDKEEKSNVKPITLNCNAPSPNGGHVRVSEKRFAELMTPLGNCCSFCSDPITPEQGPDVEWLDVDTVLCPACVEAESKFVEEFRNMSLVARNTMH